MENIEKYRDNVFFFANVYIYYKYFIYIFALKYFRNCETEKICY